MFTARVASEPARRHKVRHSAEMSLVCSTQLFSRSHPRSAQTPRPTRTPECNGDLRPKRATRQDIHANAMGAAG
eukprot:5168464-Prymnesium_polylepis.1